MKNIFLITLVFVSLNFHGTVWAHEGHDHDAPGSVQAPKGGLIKSTEEIHVEVVAKGKEIKVYFYALDLKPLDLTKQNISLKAKLPRSKKIEELTAKVSGNMMETSFDAKGAHRYTLVVGLKESQDKGGKDHGDVLNFTIEPRK